MDRYKDTQTDRHKQTDGHTDKHTAVADLDGVSLVSVEIPFQILKSSLYTYNYTTVYFRYDVASLKKSDVTESESDDCQ